MVILNVFVVVVIYVDLESCCKAAKWRVKAESVAEKRKRSRWESSSR